MPASHAPPVHRDGWVDRPGLGRWSAAYGAGAFREVDAPPAALRERARNAGVVVSSDLPRAIASAERLLGRDARVRDVAAVARGAALDA